MNNIESIKSVYFIGAGGIGMSALIRYFLSKGIKVAGYDKTSTDLTQTLIKEGAQIHYQEDETLIPEAFRSKEDTLVVFTPAIPSDHQELQYFKKEGFTIMKRAEVLGIITRSSQGLCVAGTHGKTTTSTMIAHILNESHIGCTAFLGGISKNYKTNLLLSQQSPYTVIEADEFDRSFHHLRPYMSVITATDADHLDIYGTHEAYLESFSHYTSLIKEDGVLLMHKNLEMKPRCKQGVRILTYAQDGGDFHAQNILIGGGEIVFDFVHPEGVIKDISLGVPVAVNIENGIAAMAICLMAGAKEEELRNAMASFRGVDRRFDFIYRKKDRALLLDYAHHPMEIQRSAESLKALYKDCKVTAVFQPHLYTRTRDFYEDFARSLSIFDEVILTEIYPAREEPIEGVTSQIIYDRLAEGVRKRMCLKKDVAKVLREDSYGQVVVLLGAGDIDRYQEEIKNALQG